MLVLASALKVVAVCQHRRAAKLPRIVFHVQHICLLHLARVGQHQQACSLHKLLDSKQPSAPDDTIAHLELRSRWTRSRPCHC